MAADIAKPGRRFDRLSESCDIGRGRRRGEALFGGLEVVASNFDRAPPFLGARSELSTLRCQPLDALPFRYHRKRCLELVDRDGKTGVADQRNCGLGAHAQARLASRQVIALMEARRARSSA